MRLLGLELVNGRGEPAGRLRLVWRQLLVLGPLVALAAAPVVYFASKTKAAGLTLGLAAGVLVAASVLTALRTPGRGLTERLSGTRMVPE
jgi:zinc transporter ZupT